MKIGPSLDVPTVADAAAGATARPAQAAAGRPATAAAATEQVAFSAAGQQMGALGGTPDFDQAKVDTIRDAIREGRFTVNPGAIADKLISDAAALLGPRAG